MQCTTTHNVMYHNAQCNVPQRTMQCTTTHNAMYHNAQCNVPQRTMQCTTTHNAMYHNAQCNVGYDNAQCNVPQSKIQCTTTHNAMYHNAQCNVPQRTMQCNMKHDVMYHKAQYNEPQSIIDFWHWLDSIPVLIFCLFSELWSRNATLILGLTLHIHLITATDRNLRDYSPTALLFSQSIPLSHHFVTSGQSWKTNIILVCMVVSISRRFTTVNIVGLQYNITTPSPSIVR